MIRGIPGSEQLVIGGDFNGHIGINRVGYDEAHGGFSFGSRNDSGSSLPDFASAFGCVICNLWFRKREEHLITFQSTAGKS